MDIQRWLDETALPERPPSPANKRNKAPALPAKKCKQPSKEKRRRKPSSSDSSLLDAPPQRKKPPTAPQAAFGESANGSASSDASHPSGGSGSSTLSQRYARKPRRKTRPERYEPPSKDVKARGTHVRRYRKGESNKTMRKHKRRKAGNLGTAIVQGFHAKNVPKDRLTVSTTIRLASWRCTDDWCSSSRKKNWDCSARAGRRRQSRAVAVSPPLQRPALLSS